MVLEKGTSKWTVAATVPDLFAADHPITCEGSNPPTIEGPVSGNPLPTQEASPPPASNSGVVSAEPGITVDLPPPAGAETVDEPKGSGISETTAPRKPRSDKFPEVTGYEILGELGRGGMGVVYKARQLQPQSPGRPQDDPRRRARRAGSSWPASCVEAEAVARLQHPNIVQIYEVGEHDGRPTSRWSSSTAAACDRQLAGKPQPFRAGGAS